MNAPDKIPRILLVDDAAALRAVLRAFFLNQRDEVVGELASGTHVLETVTRLKPDIVCLDYNLPDANDIELLRAIHAEQPTATTVLITGDQSPDLKANTAEAGTAGFIRLAQFFSMPLARGHHDAGSKPAP